MKASKYLLAFAAAGIVPQPAQAADKLLFGPPPAWVQQHAVEPPAGGDQAAPIRTLMLDQQVRFAPGERTTYSHLALRIQTPQGLEAGNLSFPWNPDTDELTVHKLVIRRGDQVIDVLASGQTFTTLRREQNLELATLDGVLTANIQPEGLQVGDILEIESTQKSRNPVFAGHVEATLGPIVFPVDHLHLQVSWPESLGLRLAKTDELPDWKMTKSNGENTAEMTVDGVVPALPLRDAPARFAITRMVEATDFKSWSDLAQLFAPMYAKAAQIPAQGPLRDEVERIRKASPDPVKQTEAALQLVQSRIRYLALAMGEGGLVPAAAADTWSRRYGDCKAKTALLLGILGELHIKAQPVFVSTLIGDAVADRLPEVGLFNHVLVRATVAGHDYWLDGTRTGDSSLARLAIPDFGWGLPLDPKSAQLVHMVPAPLDRPAEDLAIRMDASKGVRIPVPVEVDDTLRGDAAVAMNNGLANLVGDARAQGLKRYWQGRFDFIEVTSTDSSFDPDTGEMHLSMKGQATLEWNNGWYETDETGVGYQADFRREDGPHKDAPFAVNYPSFDRTVETIVLPPGFQVTLDKASEVDQTAGGIEYHRHASVENGVFKIERTSRSLVPEFPASGAAEAQKTLRALSDKTVYLHMPGSYRPTAGDLAVISADTPDDADSAISQGNLLLNANKYDEAETKLIHATELDPKKDMAWADLALAQFYNGETAKAEDSLAKATAINPRNTVIFHARAVMAQKRKDWPAAIDAYTKAIEIDPTDEFALSSRATARMQADQYDPALADAARTLELDPKNIYMYTIRAYMLHEQGKNEAAAAEAKALLAALPSDPNAFAAASKIYADLGMPEEARAVAAKAIGGTPTAATYFSLSQTHPSSDRAGMLADLTKALELDPKFEPALDARAALYVAQGKFDAALADANQAIGINPKGVQHYLVRAGVYQTMQQHDKALADTDEALRIQPRNVAILQERASFHFENGQKDQAIADLKQAIGIEPATVPLYLQEANMLKSMDRREDGLKVADELATANPGDSFAHVTAARIYGALGQNDKATKEIDAALAIKPEAYIYINRANLREKSDYDGRLADLDQALKLEPGNADALAAKGQLLADKKDYAGAEAVYDKQLAADPGNTYLLVNRGIAFWREGKQDAANKDFAAAQSHATTAMDLNNICYIEGLAGAGLESALDDCNKALEKVPDFPAYLDSRGLVYLRLGRLDEAIADYDKVLAKNAAMAPSLYGRAIALARKGDNDKAKADAAAALKADSTIADRFKNNGIELPDALAKP